MKKSLLTIFIIAISVFLYECKKDPKPDVFRVTEVDVDASYRTAEINGSYTFNVIPYDMKIIYSENDDLTDADTSMVYVGESDFYVSVGSLKTGTKYYYCFECYSLHSSTRSELYTFETLKVEVPIVETFEVEDVTLNFASCGGNVVSDCGAEVTERGVCWSTSQNPTINDNKTSDGSGTGAFTSQLSGLSSSTTYYVRAYATNSAGTGYGDVISFTTLKEIVKPTVQTLNVVNVSQEAAVVVGDVTSDGGAEVTERGVCWSTSQNPTINDNKTSDGTGMGTYTSNITGLNKSTTYYVRAYATNSIGTAYGEQRSFTTITVPTVITEDVADVTTDSATSGGDVTDDGGATVTARGICWSTSPYPTIDDNDGITTDGTGTGAFVSLMEHLESNTFYYVRAYATNEKGTAYGHERPFRTEAEEEEGCEPDGVIDGHEYVDLGLPSGLKWATCNVGAIKPEDYGDYFAWGETETKSEYTQDNSITYNLSMSELQSQGYIDGEGNLTPSHDAATAKWDGSWRMPTKDEIQELIDECSWKWTQINGVDGTKIIGPNGRCIFLPAAGYREGSSLIHADYDGCYWSSTPKDYLYNYHAYYLYFYDGDYHVHDYLTRCYGHTVRPVTE
ncbi:MAG: hypothetical protein IKM23_02460 [Bacteroidales bacterium]|nr:hypothetical protein [Bacteroidales bacterium]